MFETIRLTILLAFAYSPLYFMANKISWDEHAKAGAGSLLAASAAVAIAILKAHAKHKKDRKDGNERPPN